jgi:hypothetical protein
MEGSFSILIQKKKISGQSYKKEKRKKDELANNKSRINQNNTEIFTNSKKCVNKWYNSFMGSHKAVS